MAKRIKRDWGKLKEKIKKDDSFKKDFTDDRFYELKLNSKGSGGAIIRFLPGINDDSLPSIEERKHIFLYRGSWYIEGCPSIIGGKCPICEDNHELWESGIESNKDIVRTRSRKSKFIANILVIKDPAVPENEGKVFLFKYDRTIKKMIDEKINPADVDDGIESIDEPCIIYDYDEGRNLKLKASRGSFDKGGKKINFTDYKRSEWAEESMLTDEQVDYVEKNLYPLDEFISPDKFKTYDKLMSRFIKVVGGSIATKVDSEKANMNEFESETPKKEKKHVKKVSSEEKSSDILDDDDGDDEFLSSLES